MDQDQSEKIEKSKKYQTQKLWSIMSISRGILILCLGEDCANKLEGVHHACALPTPIQLSRPTHTAEVGKQKKKGPRLAISFSSKKILSVFPDTKFLSVIWTW